MDFLATLKPADWAIVFATMVGPILAAQAQKTFEGYRAHTSKKEQVFARLMATRATRLSPAHVEALNMIDVTFAGRRVFWRLRQSANEAMVQRKWREYLDALNTPTSGTSAADEVIFARRHDAFIALLGAMCEDLGFPFDVLTLRNNSYTPIAHFNLEEENAAARTGIAELLSGKRALKMEIVNLPGPPAQANPPPGAAPKP